MNDTPKYRSQINFVFCLLVESLRMSSKFRADFSMHERHALQVNTEAALKVLRSTGILWVQQYSLSLLSRSAVNLYWHSSSKTTC